MGDPLDDMRKALAILKAAPPPLRYVCTDAVSAESLMIHKGEDFHTVWFHPDTYHALVEKAKLVEAEYPQLPYALFGESESSKIRRAFYKYLQSKWGSSAPTVDDDEATGGETCS